MNRVSGQHFQMSMVINIRNSVSIPVKFDVILKGVSRVSLLTTKTHFF